MELVHAFRAEAVRASFMEEVRRGHVPVFDNIIRVKGTTTNLVRIRGGWHPGVTRKLIYERVDTKTRVWALGLPDGRMLAFKIYEPTGAAAEKKKPGEQGLASFEVEASYLKLLSDFVLTYACPHVTLLAGYMELSPEEVVRLFPEFPAPSGTSIGLLSEYAESCVGRLISRNVLEETTVLGLFFQTVHFLEVARRYFQGLFRHNDFHWGNTLVQFLDPATIKRVSLSLGKEGPPFVCYQLDDERFYLQIEQVPYRVLAWDMYFASIGPAVARRIGLPDIVPRDGDIRIKRENGQLDVISRRDANDYVDLHKFFDSVTATMLSVQSLTPMTPAIQSLLLDVVPLNLRFTSAEKPPLTRAECINRPHTSPDAVLRHPAFDRFRVKPPGNNLVAVYKFRTPVLPEEDSNKTPGSALATPLLNRNPIESWSIDQSLQEEVKADP